MTDATGLAVDLPAPIALPAVAGERLDRVLAARLEPDAVSRSRIQRWIAIGAVRVDGALALRSRRLKGFETIEVWPQPLESEQAFRPEPVALEVLHADADVLVIAKPAGLVTHPAPGNWQGTLMNGLLHRFAQTRDLPRAGIVHRLDRDTSGLLACALSERGFHRADTAIGGPVDAATLSRRRADAAAIGRQHLRCDRTRSARPPADGRGSGDALRRQVGADRLPGRRRTPRDRARPLPAA